MTLNCRRTRGKCSTPTFPYSGPSAPLRRIPRIPCLTRICWLSNILHIDLISPRPLLVRRFDRQRSRRYYQREDTPQFPFRSFFVLDRNTRHRRHCRSQDTLLVAPSPYSLRFFVARIRSSIPGELRLGSTIARHIQTRRHLQLHYREPIRIGSTIARARPTRHLQTRRQLQLYTSQLFLPHLHRGHSQSRLRHDTQLGLVAHGQDESPPDVPTSVPA